MENQEKPKTQLEKWREEEQQKKDRQNTFGNIPDKIQGFNFVLLGGDDGKKPIEKSWQNKVHKIDDPLLIKHIEAGKNYGVQSNNSLINIEGKSCFLVIIDFDKKEIQDEVISKLPETFTTTSGSSKNCYHLWFASDNNKSFKILDEQSNTLADIQGEGKQVVAPGSRHKSGSIYSVVKDIPIAFIPYAEIEAILKPFDKSPKKPEKPKKQYVPKGTATNVAEQIINSISMESILGELGIDTSRNPTQCYFHSSQGGKCLGWNTETCHCFHCEKSWNKFSLIRKAKNLSDKETFEWFADKSGMSLELKKARQEYATANDNAPSSVYTPKGQTSFYLENRPMFYDKAGLWWQWNKEEYKWEIVDEVDILNIIEEETAQDVITPKQRTIILNSLKQECRRRIPKPIRPTWIQFRNKIIDINMGIEFAATPEYFVTNPIPYRLHPENYELTPNMDRIFEEWVGKEYVKTLYEILAYCLLSDYPIHRLFCFMGSGLNGKSCFLRLLRKFVGDYNTTTTELDRLLSSRFEVTRLHKKLVCLMGETNFNEMMQTAIIKSVTGQDAIAFEYKNKTPFTETNYAKILIATNNLPTTSDKTIGWYRRWLILDFPNRFSEQKNILDEIPEEEYESLARKCVGILKDLLDRKEFTNEGSIEERMEKYEAKSDFLQKFLDDFTTQEDINGYITSTDFNRKFAEWCKENRHRSISEITLGQMLKKKGIEPQKKYFDWMFDGKGGQVRCWVGIKWK